MSGFIAKARALKEKAIDAAMNHTEAERKVREATNGDEPWGPHGTLMSEIAGFTFGYEEFPEVMGMLWKRMLKDVEPKYWRRVYKSMLLLDYLLKNGSERVIESARDRVYELKRLDDFAYIDDKGKNQGINVAHKSKDLQALLSDDDILRDARKKAKANRDKYKGVGNPNYKGDGDDFSSGGGGRRDFDSDWDRAKKSASKPGGYRDEPEEEDTKDPFGGDSSASTDNSFNPRATEAAAKPTPSSAPLFDLLGSPTAAAAPTAAFDVFGSAAPAAAAADPFGAAQSVSSAGDDFGSFAAAPAAAAPPSAGGNFGSFAAAPAAAAAPANNLMGGVGLQMGGGMGSMMPQQTMMGGGMNTMGGGMGGGMGSMMPQQTMIAPQQAGMAAMSGSGMMGSSLMTPAASSTPASAADLMGGSLLGPSSTAPKAAAAPAKPTTWSSGTGGLSINLDNLSLGGAAKAPEKPKAGTSVFGESLNSGPPQAMGGMGGGMGMQQGGMGGGMGMQQGGMGGMGGGMGMGQQQMQGGMQMGMMGGMQGGMQMGGMGMQQGGMGGGMGMGQQQMTPQQQQFMMQQQQMRMQQQGGLGGMNNMGGFGR